ncbi:Mobile element protein (plasmid) [Candidatus Enterovibrio altilux]|uniref:Mobile element protein n=1 Tax=Candidatus Enterovibrio altilux TaxID=1927128 RepID=A0A291BAN0_9GAMM|nr:Mobile element protein [Candidatus Enterovibrio luxaltus]
MRIFHAIGIRKRAIPVNVAFKTKNKGTIQHLTIDYTGLKAYGESEWKVNKYGTDGETVSLAQVTCSGKYKYA